jgi:DNA-binding MarR family transcriptional regulator
MNNQLEDMNFTYKNKRYEKGLFLNDKPISISKLKYLAVIFFLRGKYTDEFVVSNVIIAEKLGYTPHAVSEMMKKLKELGYVNNRNADNVFKGNQQNWELTVKGTMINIAGMDGALKGKF